MIESGVKINGAVVFWSITEWTSRAALETEFKGLGFDKFVPERRTNYACLKDALGDLFNKNYRIEGVEDKDSFEVVSVVKGTDRNAYNHICKATISPDRAITLTPWNSTMAYRLMENFNKYLGLVRCHAVTEALVKVIDALSGTRLRPKGSIYWLPDHRLDDWSAVANAVKRSANSGESTCYTMRVVKDTDALAAIQAALTEQIGTELARIEGEIRDKDLGSRALETRRQQANALADKITLYEEIMEKALPDLRSKIQQTNLAASQAAILASVRGEVA